MDTRELPKAKDDLEREIGLTVRDMVTKFKKETGICVSDIRIGMEEVTSMSDTSPQFVVSVTEVNLSI
ncbi:hypothetical protein ACFVYJ_01555 [Pontibacter sp. JAM-7]|uniref:hypothetical protein n=1 Tax=Pontibacter sp. JAM-7 TaxID=3366581 RepID=UPI003AF9EEEB